MRRTRIYIPASGVGGGGPPPSTANLAWGPSFGQSAGNDDSTLNSVGAISLDAVDLTANLAAQGALDLDAVDLTGDLVVQGVLDLASVDLDGALGVNGAMSLDSLELTGALGAFGGLDLDAVDLTGALVTNQALDLESVDLSGSLGAQSALVVSVAVTGMEAIEDTYLDENAADTAHGASTSLLAKTNGPVGQNEQITYLAWDFTWLGGSVESATIDIKLSTSAVLGENANFSVRTNATKPFEEDTATWNNTETPPGTQRQTISQAITTTPTVYTLTLDATTRANMPGNWVFLRLPGTGALAASTITTVSKESGTAGDRPQMDFEVTL